jgi:hypothetical protein
VTLTFDPLFLVTRLLLALLTAPADETKPIVSSVECEVKNNQLRAWATINKLPLQCTSENGSIGSVATLNCSENHRK